MEVCKKCECELVLGVTWSAGMHKSGTRLCRPCNAAKGREWAKANPERAREGQRRRQRNNPGMYREIRRTWAANNPEKCADYARRETERRRLIYASPSGSVRGKQTAEHIAKRRASLQETLSRMVKRCAKCDAEFKPTTAAQRFCSGMCWNAIARAKREDRSKINVTAAMYREMHEAHGGVCAICGSPPAKYRLAVDHCHATGRIRGLLCHPCNTTLGLVKDSPERLEKAAAYLRERAPRLADV